MSDSGRILTNNSFTCPPPPFADQPKHFFLIKLSPIGRLCLPAQAPHGIPSPPPAVGHVHTPPFSPGDFPRPPSPGGVRQPRHDARHPGEDGPPDAAGRGGHAALPEVFLRLVFGVPPPPPRGGGPGTCDPPNIKPPWLCMWGFNTLRGGGC